MDISLRVLLACVLGFVFSFAVVDRGEAAPTERFERLVMPGDLHSGHAKYEKKCEKCHKPFEKGAQNDLCLDCHKEVNNDIKKHIGMHGRLKEVDLQRPCSDCHPDHKGRDFDIMPFDKDTFNHDISDFPLRATHARRSCADCHSSGEKYRKAATQCVGCHEQDDAHRKRLGKQCDACHIEVFWGQAYYDHEKTKFKLRNAHVNVACMDCHANERYEKTGRKCVECHKMDDVHRGDFRDKCGDCHTEQSWAVPKFDHDKDTKYKLKGRHVQLFCDICHKGDVYKEINHACITCHKDFDAHKGLFGKKCQDCHDENSWTRMVFNHTRNTDYPLKGAHLTVACESCHKGDVFAELGGNCIDCHRGDDAHMGQQSERCGDCHSTDSWLEKTIFDHDLTAFPLLDSHKIVPCAECHFSAEFEMAQTACVSCHKKDDAEIHKQTLGENCELCHSSHQWKHWIFDHNKQTDYKLDGAHVKLQCFACHKDKVKKSDDIKLKSKCVNCHERDDFHNGSFGRECERCHNTRSFRDLGRR